MGFCGVFSFVLYSSLSPRCLVIVFICMYMCELSDTYMYLYICIYSYIHTIVWYIEQFYFKIQNWVHKIKNKHRQNI